MATNELDKRAEKLVNAYPVSRINETAKVEFYTGKETLTFTVKKYLSASEANMLYTRVIKSIYDDDGKLMHHFIEYVWRRAAIEAYTDLVLPEQIDDAYLYCYSGIWDEVVVNISQDQASDIYSSVMSVVKQSTARENMNAYFGDFFEGIKALISAVASMETFSSLADQLKEAIPEGE